MGFLRDLGVALGLINDEPTPPTAAQNTTYRDSYGHVDYLDGIDYLYHMTHINNVPGILQRGLLSHNQAHQRGGVTDISDRNVNDRRNWRTVNGVPLHDFANLYFNPKNPMLYRRKEIQDDIVILAFDKRLLSNEGTWFTDGNAASNATKFYYHLSDLSGLDWECIEGAYWTDYDDGRRTRCAEILVPGGIHPSWILKIIVSSPSARQKLYRFVRTDIPVEIQPWRYF